MQTQPIFNLNNTREKKRMHGEKKMHSTHCLPFQVILKVVRNNETHFHLAFVRWHEIVHIICMRFFSSLFSLLFLRSFVEIVQCT